MRDLERAGIYREYRDCFKLDEGKLRKLSEVINQFVARMSVEVSVFYYIEREDKRFFETQDIEKVLAEDNGDGKRIYRMIIGINDKNDKQIQPYCLIEFDQKSEYIRLTLDWKDRDWCFLFCDELETQISRIIKKGSFVVLNKHRQTIDFTIASASWLVLVCIYYLNRMNNSMIEYNKLLKLPIEVKINKILLLCFEKSFLPAEENTPIILFFIGLAFVVFKPVKRIINKSPSVFYWGDMINIYDSIIKRRSNILWGVIIALLVSITAGMIMKHIGM